MNIVSLIGNIVRDPELKATPQGTSVCDFTIAVQRNYKNANGEYDADFINCTAWRNTADFVAKYFVKGSAIGVTGSLQTRKYTTKNGDERHITEVIVAGAEFIGKKPEKKQEGLDEFADLKPADEGDLPF